MKLSTLLSTASLGALTSALALPLSPVNDAAQSNTLLSVLAQQPNLSMFSSMIQQTGGSRPNPAFEERLNSALNTRNCTVFVPSNAAMLKLPTATPDLLARPQSYEVMESLIRVHISEGLYSTANLTSSSSLVQPQMTSMEGFPLSLSIRSCYQGSGPTFKPNDAALDLTDIPASNGRIHTLDRMLNPHSRYFGISNSSAGPAGGILQNGTTMAGILASDTRLSVLNKQIMTIDPDFLTQLSLSKPGDEKQIYLAPSNDAFQNIGVESMSAPSNVGLSAYLLRFGLLRGNLDALNMHAEGEVGSISGFNVTVRKSGEALVVGNAVVVARNVCADNGCVWIVDSMLDPLFGAMG